MEGKCLLYLRMRPLNIFWSVYSRLMTNGELEMYGEDCNTGKEQKPTMTLLPSLDPWNMTFMECLRTDENRGRTKMKEFVRTFQNFDSTAMKMGVWLLYKVK